MPNDLSDSNLHRRKEDGSHDSICLACLATISSGNAAGSTEEDPPAHVCAFSFGSIRSSPSV
jgi:hypothetical protein